MERSRNIFALIISHCCSCLLYTSPLMQSVNKTFRVGMKVISDEGEGQIVYVNSQKHSVRIQLDGGQTKTMSWDLVEQVENE